MRPSRFPRLLRLPRPHPAGMLAFMLLLGAAAALAVGGPGAVACSLVHTGGLAALPDGTLVEPGRTAQEQAEVLRLLAEARERITLTYGPPRAQPAVVFLQVPRRHGLPLNSYGSTSIVGSRACVVIGPQGHNTDVVAHELMHAEVFARTGFWRHLRHVPAWFDEGVAMQVDRRPAYALPADGRVDTAFVRQLDTQRAFNATADDAQLTRHYAAAKAEVTQWLSGVGAQSLYARLDRLGQGEAFDDIME
jgi:hypothetical protein